MHNREDVINEIIRHLAVLKEEVALRSKVNLQDINVHAEQFYKILLNNVFGYELKNINIVDQNAAVIDLGDKENRIAIQVTSNNSKKKLLETVSAFNAKDLFKQYDRLIILVIKDKIKRDGAVSTVDFSFDLDRDVMDVAQLTRHIQGIDELDILNNINSWLYNELVKKHYDSRKESKPTEVETLLRMIDILGNEENHKAFELEEEPDPEYKIEDRFKDYSSFLKMLYSELLLDYGHALSTVESSGDVSSVKIRRVGIYLKDVSNRYLISAKNDPQSALDNLTEYFSSFFKKDGLCYDEMAIKFYLIHQIIKCNVFPN
jgi:hypothetical protein